MGKEYLRPETLSRLGFGEREPLQFVGNSGEQGEAYFGRVRQGEVKIRIAIVRICKSDTAKRDLYRIGSYYETADADIELEQLRQIAVGDAGAMQKNLEDKLLKEERKFTGIK